MANNTIREYVGSLITYPIPSAAVDRIMEERGLNEIEDWADVTRRTRNLVIADLLFAMFTAPSNTGSKSRQHGDFSITIGGVIITDKNDIYALMMKLYQNPEQELWEALNDIGGCEFLDVL